MPDPSPPIVACPACGARNRLRAAPDGRVPACGRCGSSLPWLVDARDATFDREIRAAVPALVDFWAEWCGPCRVVAPVLRELSVELAGRVKIVKVDVDANPVTAGRFAVRSIPTLALFRGGILVDQVAGALPKGALRARLEPHLPPPAGAGGGADAAPTAGA